MTECKKNDIDLKQSSTNSQKVDITEDETSPLKQVGDNVSILADIIPPYLVDQAQVSSLPQTVQTISGNDYDGDKLYPSIIIGNVEEEVEAKACIDSEKVNGRTKIVDRTGFADVSKFALDRRDKVILVI